MSESEWSVIVTGWRVGLGVYALLMVVVAVQWLRGVLTPKEVHDLVMTDAPSVAFWVTQITIMGIGLWRTP